MVSGSILPEGDRDDIRRIVRISRITGVVVACSLGVAAYWVQHNDPLSLQAIVSYVIVVVGLGAFVALSTLARVGHAKVLERALQEVRTLSGKLREMAEQDPLTGLFNLRTFHALVEQEIDLARLERSHVSLIVADLDNFKVLNDSFGHQFGDMVLCETAKVFASAGPHGSQSARLGGDEFALLLPGLGRDEAVSVASVIDARLRQYGIEGAAASTLGSFGVATFPSDGDSVQALFAAADGRMYSEKHRRKAESLASLAGASRKLFVRVGRAMRPDRTMTQILQEVARAAREEFDLTLAAITIRPRAHHPRVNAVSTDDLALEAACIEAADRDQLNAAALGARLPADAWVIDTPVPDESGDGGSLALAGLPMSSFRPDAPVVLALADLVQAVVANARSRVEAASAGRERDIHIELAHILAGGGPLHERLSNVTRKIAAFIGAPMVTIQGIATGIGPSAFNVATGFSDVPREPWLAVRTSPEGRALIEALAEEAPRLFIEPADDERVPDYERELLAAAGARVAAVCPIRFDGELLGIVCALSTEPDYFTEETVAVLMNIADHVAPAINVALLRDQLEASYSELERESRESLSRLADAAEARDPHTGGHLRRIRYYSVELARTVGLSEEEAQAIGLASTVHDLGKLSLSDDVLHKPGKLTQDDWAQMRAHPQYGERLIGRSPKFDIERVVARWHHERWDGSGYPDGLRGEAIPLAARIVAVADAFDALTTERPYKRAWTLDEAVAEVVASRGRLFCPRVVDALESLWRSGRLAEIYEAAEQDERGTRRQQRKAA